MDREHPAVAPDRLIHPYLLAGLIPACFFLLFYFYPLSGILWKSFLSDSGSFWDSIQQITGSKRVLSIIWFTFWQALCSALLTLICALPCAYVFSHFRFAGKKLLLTLSSIPFVLPAIVVATAFQTSFGKKGLLADLGIHHPLALIFLAHVFYNFSVMVRIITSFWTSLQGKMNEAAQTLGANPRQRFFYITLPLLKPAILAACALVFIFCFSSFGIILILGGPSFATIETEIYRQAAHMFNLPLASVLSLFQIGFTFVLMCYYTRFTRKAAQFMPDSGIRTLKRPHSLKEHAMVLCTSFFIILLCIVPMAGLVLHSLQHKGTFSLAFYRALFENRSDSIFYIPPFHAVGYSLAFAGCALVIALITGLCAALFIRFCDRRFTRSWSSLFDPIFMLPLSTSAVTLGFGIIITLDKPPLNLRTSFFLIPIAHALVGFPFVIRAILPAIRSIPDVLTDASATLGASPIATFRHIILPLISKSVIAASIFAFTISLGEFGATIFTARPETPTIPVAIYRFLGQPGALNHGQALAMSTILMVITAMGYLFIEQFRTTSGDGF
jgi:thiamine transport system permease protein